MKKYFFFFIILISNFVHAQNKIFFAHNHTKVPASNPSQSYNALNFSTSLQNYATLPAATYFSGNFTIECWVYPTAHTNWSRIIDFGNGAGSNCVLFATSYGTSGKPGFYVGGAQFEANSQIPLNQWTHLAATLSGSTATIYINGIASGSANFPTPANVTRNNNYIGRSNWGWGDPAPDATFDDLRIWSVAKTAAEITASMNNELSGSESNLVAYFKFNEGIACGNNTSVTTLVNSAATGAQYNATLSGFAFNNSCISNFISGKLRPTNDGLTSATAGSSAYQIKQDFPASTDGLYWIKNANINSGNAFQIYADMTTDGGGWTLILKNSSNSGWNYANAISLNTSIPFANTSDVLNINTSNYSTRKKNRTPLCTVCNPIGTSSSLKEDELYRFIKSNYSGEVIQSWIDVLEIDLYLPDLKLGFEFQYMIDATSRRSSGGIWTANGSYSFVKTDNSQTNITLNTKFGDWNYVSENGLMQRMPWYSSSAGGGCGVITVDEGSGNWWGTLVSLCGWSPTPWIYDAGGGTVNPDPGILWYWVR